MNLSNYNTTDEARFLHLRHPSSNAKLFTGADPKEPIGITLFGSDSARFRKAQHAQQTRRLSGASKRGRIKLRSEEIEADATDLMVAVTESLHNVELDKPLENSESNYRKLYDILWIRDQVDDFINERENYVGNSLTNS